MHKLCKICIFKKCLKTTFVGISDDSEHISFFYLNFFRDLEKKSIMHKLCKICIFKICLKTTFVGISDDSEHFFFFYLQFFRDLEKKFNDA